MNKQKILLIGVIIVAISSVSLAINYYLQPPELQSQNYEDVCGYPVTDEMRLDKIYNTKFSRETFSEKYPDADFTHVERSQYLTDPPLLQYWFEVKNNQQVYVEIGACALDDSKMVLTIIGPNYEKRQGTDYDASKYEILEAPGYPLIYKDTLKPVLDHDNCKRVADGYTEQQREEIVTRENSSYGPIWGNQIFPLMDYCAGLGIYEMTVVDDQIQWTFTILD